MTKAGELRELTTEELEARLTEAKAELFNLRFQFATGQFDRTHRFKDLRQEVARILTILGEQAAEDVDTEEAVAAERLSLRARLRARRQARAERLGQVEQAAAGHAGEGVELVAPGREEEEEEEGEAEEEEEEEGEAEGAGSDEVEAGDSSPAERDEVEAAGSAPAAGEDADSDPDDTAGLDEAADAATAEAVSAADEPEGPPPETEDEESHE